MKQVGRRRLLAAPISLQILALLLVGLVLAQVATLTMTLLLPPSPPAFHDLQAIARALQGVRGQKDRAELLERTVETAPPSLQSPGWQVSERSSAELARLLDVEPSRVRLLFYAPPPFAGVGGPAPRGERPPPPPNFQPTSEPMPRRPKELVLASFAIIRLPIAQGDSLMQAAPGRRGGEGPVRGGQYPGPDRQPPYPGTRDSGARNPGAGGDVESRGPWPGRPPIASPFPSGADPRIERQTRPDRERTSFPGDPPQRPQRTEGPQTQFPPGGLPRGPILTPQGHPIPGPLTLPPLRTELPLPPAPEPATRPAVRAVGPGRLESAQPSPLEPAVPRTTPRTVLALPSPTRFPAVALAPATAAVAGRPLPPPAASGLFGLAPPPFILGDFVAALQVGPDAWATVQPTSKGGLLNEWQKRVLLWFLISFALVAPLGYLFARRLAAPLDQFARAAERLGRDPSAPAPAIDGPAEVGRAAHAFNQMQARIRRYVDDRNGMIGAISHDLRTPLSRMRFRLERTPPEVRAALARDIDQMEEMISSVLTFMRDDAEASGRQRVDLRSILEVVTDDAALGGGSVELEPGAPAEVEVDVLSVQRAFANLIDNALKYGHEANIRLFMDQGEAVTEIRDKGDGLRDEELERVFLPFYRGQSATANRRGVGLGLAVSRSTVRAHGGDIQLRRAAQGLVAEVRLPTIKTAA